MFGLVEYFYLTRTPKKFTGERRVFSTDGAGITRVPYGNDEV